MALSRWKDNGEGPACGELGSQAEGPGGRRAAPPGARLLPGQEPAQTSPRLCGKQPTAASGVSPKEEAGGLRPHSPVTPFALRQPA